MELSKSYRLKEWPKSIKLLKKNKNMLKDDVTELLLAVYPLLTTFSPNDEDVQEKDKWDELRKLTISKARRMRVHNPNSYVK
ncbi:hypothetical protein [Dyadobacter sp. 3J3]|uniref:hypothetical protein n=1 Tax=Dyadobacter sp. 3J3 TaxID=2606600 RepID=UPI00135A1C97|nr:hypothetical protein [Dyadobacter sp. 3J3]